MDSSCLAIFAPYINYISPTNIEFHINYSTSTAQYGFFWNKELADLFSKIFCSSCTLVEVYDGSGNRLGYRNVFTKINKKYMHQLIQLFHITAIQTGILTIQDMFLDYHQGPIFGLQGDARHLRMCIIELE